MFPRSERIYFESTLASVQVGWLLQVSERLCCNIISPVAWHGSLMDRPGKPITEAGEKAEAFNVLFNSLFMRDIRCEGAGTVPSFDESKESQNRKRVKKCFEGWELFTLVRHAAY